MGRTQSEIDRGEEDQLYNESIGELEYKNQSLEAELDDSDRLVGDLYEEVDRLTNLVIECRNYATVIVKANPRSLAVRICEITKEFANE